MEDADGMPSPLCPLSLSPAIEPPIGQFGETLENQPAHCAPNPGHWVCWFPQVCPEAGSSCDTGRIKEDVLLEGVGLARDICVSLLG